MSLSFTELIDTLAEGSGGGSARTSSPLQTTDVETPDESGVFPVPLAKPRPRPGKAEAKLSPASPGDTQPRALKKLPAAAAAASSKTPVGGDVPSRPRNDTAANSSARRDAPPSSPNQSSESKRTPVAAAKPIVKPVAKPAAKPVAKPVAKPASPPSPPSPPPPPEDADAAVDLDAETNGLIDDAPEVQDGVNYQRLHHEALVANDEAQKEVFGVKLKRIKRLQEEEEADELQAELDGLGDGTDVPSRAVLPSTARAAEEARRAREAIVTARKRKDGDAAPVRGNDKRVKPSNPLAKGSRFVEDMAEVAAGGEEEGEEEEEEEEEDDKDDEETDDDEHATESQCEEDPRDEADIEDDEAAVAAAEAAEARLAAQVRLGEAGKGGSKSKPLPTKQTKLKPGGDDVDPKSVQQSAVMKQGQDVYRRVCVCNPPKWIQMVELKSGRVPVDCIIWARKAGATDTKVSSCKGFVCTSYNKAKHEFSYKPVGTKPVFTCASSKRGPSDVPITFKALHAADNKAECTGCHVEHPIIPQRAYAIMRKENGVKKGAAVSKTSKPRARAASVQQYDDAAAAAGEEEDCTVLERRATKPPAPSASAASGVKANVFATDTANAHGRLVAIAEALQTRQGQGKDLGEALATALKSSIPENVTQLGASVRTWDSKTALTNAQGVLKTLKRAPGKIVDAFVSEFDQVITAAKQNDPDLAAISPQAISILRKLARQQAAKSAMLLLLGHPSGQTAVADRLQQLYPEVCPPTAPRPSANGKSRQTALDDLGSMNGF
jgi:hypothetical protein